MEYWINGVRISIIHRSSLQHSVRFTFGSSSSRLGYTMYKNERGFTTVELIVTMGLVGLISALAYAVYIFAYQAMKNWQDRVELENSTHLMMNAMANDFSDIKKIFYATEDEISFIKINADTVRYAICEGGLIRNGKYLNKKDLSIGSIQFNFFGSELSDDLNMDRVIDMNELDRNSNRLLDGEELLDISCVQFTIKLASKKHSFELQSAVVIRNLPILIRE
jgi:prepilin-type N-terminal cleavage/methylation domain-containing protein